MSQEKIEDISQVMKIRRQKLEELKGLGVNPYPYSFGRTHYSKDIVEDYDNYEGRVVSIAGRLMSIRGHGKAGFGHVMDSKGKIQIYARQDQLGEESYKVFQLLDIGDIIGVTGSIFKTRTGEITVKVQQLQLLAKTLRPLPAVKEKIEADGRVVYHQFSDKELRYRQRYVDLIVNPEVREVFIKRTNIISAMRGYLDDQGFLEVETPILQPIYGGAFARPFVTHHNALDMELYLRIADELYLKRLVVGGFEGVYEFCKDFRNEGIDRLHNPEFTMMELYVAYKDYRHMMELVEDMISKIAMEVLGSNDITCQGHKINLSPPWPRVRMFDALREHTGRQLYGKDTDELRAIAEELNVEIEPFWDRGKIIDEVFSELVQPNLIQPTFIIDYPIEISPLAKKHQDEPNVVERFECFIGGREIGNAFSELNDPIDQRARFEQQMELRRLGDEEAQVMDEDFIRALEYGMPPTAGLGVGIDRLVMILTDQPSLRDVIFFPQMRAEG